MLGVGWPEIVVIVILLVALLWFIVRRSRRTPPSQPTRDDLARRADHQRDVGRPEHGQNPSTASWSDHTGAGS